MHLYSIYRPLFNIKLTEVEKLSPGGEELRQKLENVQKMRKVGISWEDIARICKISRSNYYRIAKRVREIGIKGFMMESRRPKNVRQSAIPIEVRQAILAIRKDNHTYGKVKIAVILKRDYGITLSTSSIGRVLAKLRIEQRITRSISARKVRRKRKFADKHAKPWQYGKHRAKKPGEMMQLDHMSVSKNSISLKHFAVWDPISRYMHASVYTNATSKSAKKFLHELISTAPFRVSSIQVDGGSEFMDEFELACKELNIELYVLPPRRPQYNGGVERSNRTFREEFYSRDDLLADSVGAFRYELRNAVRKYNEYRPHCSLAYRTPMEYLSECCI